MPLKPSHKKELYCFLGRGERALYFRSGDYSKVCPCKVQKHLCTWEHIYPCDKVNHVFHIVKGESYFSLLLTTNSVILNKKQIIHWSICVWIFVASLHRWCCVDVLGRSLRRLFFSKERKQHVSSGITLKHQAEVLAFGFLDWNRLCRNTLDVYLMHILSFPKMEGDMHKAQRAVYFHADTGWKLPWKNKVSWGNWYYYVL